jgi:putative tryptophan/tyrosine transport system substrate-binding protein
MLNAFKRLWLGLCLIVLTSAILLVTDRPHRAASGPAAAKRIAIVQHASTSVLDDGVRGVIDGLASRGYREGEQLTIERFNAHGDMPTGIAIAKQVVAGGYDLVITSSTPSMQAVANNNKDGKAKHLFTLVADPFASGIGLDRANPLAHPPYLAGQSSFPPVERAFQIAKQMLPGLQRIGVAWNPAESNSLIFVTKAREITKGMGLTLLEANVDNTSAVGEAVNALVSRDAQAIWVGGDNTVVGAINVVIETAARSRIPVFTILPGKPDRGTLFDAGPDFYGVGRLGGELAAEILSGADMSKIPVRDVLDLIPPYLSINTTALKGLREPWQAPPPLLADATAVVDDTGVHRKNAPVAADARATNRKWKVSFIELVQVLDLEEAEKGVLDGLKESGLVEGRDFEKTIRNAQGDMATLPALVDAAVGDGADLLITFSTPTLQAALQRGKRVPIVFNYVADAVAAGAGTSDKDHLPNVTGVYLIAAYDKMLPLIKEYMPHVRTLGTVYVPAEVNMVSQLAVLQKAVAAHGLELKPIAANSATEVGDAALALAAAHVDAICQLPGNLTAQAFPSIAQAAKRARLPIFSFQTSQVLAGAVAGVTRDYYDSGREAAHIAARVMRGESPATIPFVGFSKTKLVVNIEAAQAAGLKTPAAVVQRADQVAGR